MNNLNWEEKFENALNITEKDYYNILSTINKEENKEIIEIIPIEVKRTLSDEFINKNPEFVVNLEEILKIFTISNSLGYISGMSFIAKTILKLTNNNKIKAFIILRNIFEDNNLKILYNNDDQKIKDMYHKFELKLKEKIPILYNHFKKYNIEHTMYIISWLKPLFSFGFDDKIGEYIFKKYIIQKDFNVYYDAALSVLKCFENELLSAKNYEGIYPILFSIRNKVDINKFIENMKNFNK